MNYPFLTLKERDVETGLDYFLARYYSSVQGRFTSADSFGGSTFNPQTLNLYSYVNNNPLGFTDPTGHYAFPGSEGDPCQGQVLCQQDPDTNNLPPARKPGDAFPVASCSGCGSPFGKIAVVDVIDYKPVSTTSDVLATSVDLKPVLPPSWVDYVPVVSNARKFLFHYTTHNFEAALLDFSVMSVELGTANVAASAGAAKSFATETGEAIFYSGRGSFQLATQAARSEGGKLITDTLGGRALNFLTKPLPERVADPVWKWGPKHFAEGASGTVRTFLREPMRVNSTWRQVEYPILRVNPFVRITPR